jgi:ketosteroid isomerase-like protein
LSSKESGPGGPTEVVERLYRATNAHDLDAIVSCFAVDYRNETPAHPDRSFTGNEQVRRNWTQILAAIPDITAAILQSVEQGEHVWIETVQSGTRPDGNRHQMGGVIIFRVTGDVITSARFYLEPVQSDGADADTAVRQHLRSPAMQ